MSEASQKHKILEKSKKKIFTRKMVYLWYLKFIIKSVYPSTFSVPIHILENISRNKIKIENFLLVTVSLRECHVSNNFDN